MGERVIGSWILCAVAACALSACGGGGASPSEPGPDTAVAADAVGPGDGSVGGDTAAGVDTSGPAVEIDPGRVVWRRLNRTEYRNTVRELFGAGLDPGADLPADDLGYGFDNIASVLTLSPLHLELYERAARLLTAEATRPPVTEPVRLWIEGEAAASTVEYGDPVDGAYLMGSGGELSGYVVVPRAGTWSFELRAWETAAGDERTKLVVWVDGVAVHLFEVVAEPATYTLEIELSAGRHALGVEFINDYYAPPEDRNAWVDGFGVVGPATLETYAGSAWDRVVPCRPEALDRACAEAAVGELARRAWRRPVDPSDRASLMGLFDEAVAAGTPLPEALSLPLQAVMLSPRFLFKVELSDDPTSPAAEPLDGYELATRLSYFLWSTMPDEALFLAAASGVLDTPEGLAREVRRMLADPRAEALISNFAGQWLYIRDIANVIPDPWVFPEFDDALRHAMAEELRLFFRSFVFEDRSMIELLTATDTWVNRRLAEHYGVDGVAGVPADDTTFARVELGAVVAAQTRRGVLAKAGLLTALSTPFRTSIVRRGKWALSQLLCAEPSPPPPGVEGLLEANGDPTQPKTLRERMELHKTEERCKTCHVAMDGIGFALERYDGVGAWRETDNGFPIDATGELRGKPYDGPVELAEVIAADARLPACLVDKVAIYALGRGLRGEDEPLLDRLVADFAARGHRFAALVELIATSEAFRMRRGEP